MRWTILWVLVVAMTAGCTDDGEDAGTMPSEPTAPPADPAPPSNPPSLPPDETNETGKRDPVTWDLDIEDNRFPGGSITIQVGDTVRWTHRGNAPHSVTSTSGEDFDSSPQCQNPTVAGCMLGGDTFSYTFEAVGDTSYYCKVHPSMTGTITVQERFDDTP